MESIVPQRRMVEFEVKRRKGKLAMGTTNTQESDGRERPEESSVPQSADRFVRAMARRLARMDCEGPHRYMICKYSGEPVDKWCVPCAASVWLEQIKGSTGEAGSRTR